MLKCSPGRKAQQEYWLEARFRHDFWCSQLAAHRQNLSGGSAMVRRQSWCRIFPVLEEILLTEPLARCVAYHARLLAEHGIETDLTAVAQSVLSSHVEARHRCLHLIVFGESLESSHSCRLNQLRRCLENYTDSLLSFFESVRGEDIYSFDPSRVRTAQQSRATQSHPAEAKRLVLAFLPQAMRKAVEGHLTDGQSHHQANERMHAIVLRLLSSSLFDSLGLPISSVAARIRRQPSDCSIVAESLCQGYAISQLLFASPTRLQSHSRGTEKPRW
jgi:hypothetical protein